MNIIESIKQWWNENEVSRQKRTDKYLKERASEVFQVKEYGNDIWFTYSGNLICPMSFFNEKDVPTMLHSLRDLWIIRNGGKTTDTSDEEKR